MTAAWEPKIRALSADLRSPSSVLALRAGDLLREVASTDPELLAEAARAIVLSQPALAAVANVANFVLRAVEVLGMASVGNALDSLRQGLDADRHAAAAALVERVHSPVRVVTTSANVLVAEVIQALHRRELLAGVVCAESRPLHEGTAFARWLAAQERTVTLVSDAGLCAHLEGNAILVVGVESILPRHVVHRTGTRMHAVWARLAGVPRFALATRDRIYPQELLGRFALPSHPPSELLRDPPAGLSVDSRAYDVSEHETWSEILVGGQPVAIAEHRGDHKLARCLEQLVV